MAIGWLGLNYSISHQIGVIHQHNPNNTLDRLEDIGVQIDQHSSTCPVCNSEGEPIRSLDIKFILKNMELYYHEKVPDDVEVANYKMYCCKNCSLEYAVPLEAGSDQFYRWITNRPRYYPEARWEWSIVIDQIKKGGLHVNRFLEIGCGSGKFLEIGKQVTQLRGVGLDTTIDSVEKCLAKGFEVYCASIQAFGGNLKNKSQGFDFVVAFHCLEHVVNPKEFVSSMLKLLKPSGKIYLSTPFSPMSFEPVWFDPLNHPPHHLTRWNTLSYKELARQLNLNIAFFMPDAANIIDRTLYTLNLSWNGPNNLAPKMRIVAAAMMHPLTALKEIGRQKKRVKVNNKVAANVVLVELTRNDVRVS